VPNAAAASLLLLQLFCHMLLLLLLLSHLVGALAQAHEEVVWLDVPVDEAARVHVFHARNLQKQRSICGDQQQQQEGLRQTVKH
jgi:hypothetical protein